MNVTTPAINVGVIILTLYHHILAIFSVTQHFLQCGCKIRITAGYKKLELRGKMNVSIYIRTNIHEKKRIQHVVLENTLTGIK